MPIYEYQCPACGHGQEVLQKMGEDGLLLICAGCGHQGLERQLSVVARTASGAGPAASACGGQGNCGFS
ncbi:MAG: zinc ribbon domain-containing protein [Deltaproteobacteria bacterium]|nr:zinc ribbon domain-containing protein [Deltaproteobacteria bacterium]